MGRRFRLGLALLALTAATPLRAESRKLGFADLPSGLERGFWSEVDDMAGYAALLSLCGRNPDLERRFREAVSGCIDAESLDKTARFYRSRYAYTMAHASRHPCDDPVFVERRLPEKLSALIESRIGQARSLCQGYLKTGQYGRN